LKVDILSGAEEADLVFAGVTTDAALARDPLLLLDVGGGSTEFILGQGSRKDFRASFALGSVRLLEMLPHSDPPTREEIAGLSPMDRGILEDGRCNRKIAAGGARLPRCALGRFHKRPSNPSWARAARDDSGANRGGADRFDRFTN